MFSSVTGCERSLADNMLITLVCLDIRQEPLHTHKITQRWQSRRLSFPSSC